MVNLGNRKLALLIIGMFFIGFLGVKGDELSRSTFNDEEIASASFSTGSDFPTQQNSSEDTSAEDISGSSQEDLIHETEEAVESVIGGNETDDGGHNKTTEVYKIIKVIEKVSSPESGEEELNETERSHGTENVTEDHTNQTETSEIENITHEKQEEFPEDISNSSDNLTEEADQNLSYEPLKNDSDGSDNFTKGIGENLTDDLPPSNKSSNGSDIEGPEVNITRPVLDLPTNVTDNVTEDIINETENTTVKTPGPVNNSTVGPPDTANKTNLSEVKPPAEPIDVENGSNHSNNLPDRNMSLNDSEVEPNSSEDLQLPDIHENDTEDPSDQIVSDQNISVHTENGTLNKTPDPVMQNRNVTQKEDTDAEDKGIDKEEEDRERGELRKMPSGDNLSHPGKGRPEHAGGDRGEKRSDD